MRLKVKIGDRFGRLTLISILQHENGRRNGVFQCDCGVVKEIRISHVQQGRTVSCCCARPERARRMGQSTKRHGLKDSPEWSVWSSMRQRCNSPSHHAYANYGERGIMICERWSSFENFYADMGPRPSSAHSLDRVDNNGHYEPGNCRWATKLEQGANRRTSRPVEYKGVQMTLSEWARVTGIKRSTIAERLRRGWSIDSALLPLKPIV
jgi:hypothetical protein